MTNQIKMKVRTMTAKNFSNLLTDALTLIKQSEVAEFNGKPYKARRKTGEQLLKNFDYYMDAVEAFGHPEYDAIVADGLLDGR